MFKQFIHKIYLFVFFVATSTSVFALDQQTRTWAGVDVSGAVFGLSHWIYDVWEQSRYSITQNQYISTHTEAGLGYKVQPNLSFWFGYNWINFNPDTTQQQRIWQQILWTMINKDQIQLNSRTRLEERWESNQPQWSIRMRERLQLSFPNLLSNRYTPIIFDEIFFNLNNPVWVNSQFIHQNRLFLGLSIPLLRHMNLQIGYLNQFQIENANISNRMNHILYLNINIDT